MRCDGYRVDLMTAESRLSRGTKVGFLGSILGGITALVLLFVPLGRREQCTPGGECEVLRGTAGIDYILGVEGTDPTLFFWSMFILGFALVGGYGAWTETRSIVWLTRLALLALTLLGAASIGLFVAPAALLFLFAGILLPSAHDADSPDR